MSIRTRGIGLWTLVPALAAVPGSAVVGQGPKIVPPRACEVPPAARLAAGLTERTPRDKRVRVAVVSFEESVSDDARLHLTWAAGQHIADGLRAVPGLAVESQGVVARAWMESGGRIEELVRVLDADFVVTGRSAMRGTEAEISVTLWQASAEASRWDRTFIYPSLSLRQIEDSSIAYIVSFTGVQPPPAPNRGSENASYEAIARGDYFLRRPGTSAADSARAAYERAVESDPSSALAKVRLARAYAVALERSGRVARLDAKSAIARGLALVDSAARVDEKLGDAWTVQAMLLRLQDPHRLSGAVEAHRKAVSVTPNDADAHHEYGETLLLLGDDRGALERFRRALALEPNRPSTLRAYAELEMVGRRFAASCALLNASVLANEYDPLTYAQRARVRLQLGEFRDAYADAEIAARLSGDRWGEAFMAFVLASAGNTDRAKRETKQLADSWLRGNAPLRVREARYLAGALTLMGDTTRAITALARARPEGAELRLALRDPVFDRIRSSPGFRQLTRPTPE